MIKNSTSGLYRLQLLLHHVELNEEHVDDFSF